MRGRKKTEWVIKREELEKDLPPKFDGKTFKGCRVDGKYDKAKITELCEKKKIKDNADAIFAYLSHLNEKPAPKKHTGASKKVKPVEAKTESNLLSKATYKNLTALQIKKLIEMLGKIQAQQKEKEIKDIERKMANDAKLLKVLKGK